MPDTVPKIASPPIAKPIPTSTTLHGERRTDNYSWLRDRDNPETISYLEAENAYTAAMMEHTEPLQKSLFDEMLARIKEDDTDVPVRRDDWLYYERTEQGKPYPIYCRRRDKTGSPEEVIFDQNAAAEGHEFYQLGAFEVSPDHRRLALLVDTNGYEDFVLRVKDLLTGSFLPDTADALGFGLAWASDGHTLFYQTTDSAKRADKVWRHRLGEPRRNDVEVYHDPDPLFNVGVRRSRSGEFVLITSSSFTSSESWLLDARAPESAPRVVAPRAPDVEYDVDDGGDWLYLLTNRDGARDFKVMRAPVSDPSTWTDWLPARAGVFVEGVDVFRDFIVVQEREHGLRRLRVMSLDGGDAHYIEFPEAAYGVTFDENPEFATDTIRFTYSSLITPDSVYDYDVRKRTRELRKRDEVLGGYDPSAYGVERLMAPARDGALVPVSLVYRAPLVRDGKRPLVLYAYGAYGHIIEPTFSATRLSLLDRGFVYAIAHVRGGQDMGRAWYDEGKMGAKMNTFFDFIDSAQYLARERYTATDRLVAHGGSAGGLLMGAIANLGGELFRAVVADVPFVDVINTMLDASIPLTAQEWEQWGNPAVAGDYAYMRKYSPYDNVRRMAYPRMLVMSGVNDSRVAFWEPAKWVAKLRTHKTDSHPLLLRMNMGAGHGGSTGRYERLKEIAFRYAFMIDQIPKA
ncbi:MAG TPA: S9 family peptidase [Gemmatimonadaceae bacterium]